MALSACPFLLFSEPCSDQFDQWVLSSLIDNMRMQQVQETP